MCCILWFSLILWNKKKLILRMQQSCPSVCFTSLPQTFSNTARASLASHLSRTSVRCLHISRPYSQLPPSPCSFECARGRRCASPDRTEALMHDSLLQPSARSSLPFGLTPRVSWLGGACWVWSAELTMHAGKKWAREVQANRLP